MESVPEIPTIAHADPQTNIGCIAGEKRIVQVGLYILKSIAWRGRDGVH